MSSSVALARWSWRLTRREWRQHLLVTALVAAAVMLVTLGALAINNITREDPDYGSATHLVKVATDGRSLDSATSATLESFGPVAVTAWRTPQTVAGESGSVELSDMGLKSTLGGTNLTLIEGKMPDAEGQIAITRRLQISLTVKLNETIDFADMKVQTVVGIIEDPNDLTRRLGILGPGTITDPSYVDVALQMSDVEFSALTTSLGDQLLGSTAIEPGGSRVASFFLIALLCGVAMVELGLLCSAGFAVLARRRLRQFGMLSALGASERNLRVTMTLTGVMVGSIGATMGVTAGYAASRALQGRFESGLGWRFRTWGLPVKIVLPLMVLAITTAGLSAWWPSRSVSRLSIVNLLAARRPAGKPATRSALFGVAIALGGAALFNWGVATRTVLAAFVGLFVSLGGVLLLAPTFVRHIGRLSAHLPLSGRIAGRDLARHQTRSASALAAIVLALGIPLGFVLSSSSAEARLSNETPNLPANLALFFQYLNR
jgi:putative ABC transport system permease protein